MIYMFLSDSKTNIQLLDIMNFVFRTLVLAGHIILNLNKSYFLFPHISFFLFHLILGS